MDNHIFRTAVGGFNRQDVTDYIEKTRRQAEETAAGLEKQAEELRAALSAAQAERDETRAVLEKRVEELEEARRQRDKGIQTLTAEKGSLTARVKALEKELETLCREKAQVAQLELDAHRRSDEIIAQASATADARLREAERQARVIVTQGEAQAAATVSEADARAEALLRQAEERIAATVGYYDELHRNFAAITSHIISELRRLDVAAGQLPLSFDALKDELGELLEQAKKR